MLKIIKNIIYFFINIFDFKFDFPLPPRQITRLFQISFWITFFHLYHIRKEREKLIKNDHWKDYKVKKTSLQDWLSKIFLVQYGTVRNKKVYNIISKDNGVKNILDVGCGSGASSVCFLMEFFDYRFPKGNLNTNYEKLNFYGIDISSSRIEEAKVKLPILFNYFKEKVSLNFSKGDVKNLNFNDNFFDYVIVASILDYLDEKSFLIAIKEICRVSKKGIHIVDFADRYPLNKPRSHEIFKNAMKKFDFKLIFYNYRITKSYPAIIRNQLVLDMFFTNGHE